MAGTPLTDAINALTTYANTVTGQNDPDLSSAVATLASGYGGGGGSVLPTGYTQMLYLESSGSQYIDTGLYTKLSHEYAVSWMRTNVSGTQNNVFGNNVSGCASFIQDTTGGKDIYEQFGSATYAYTTLASNFTDRNFKLNKDGLWHWNTSTLQYEKVLTITGTTVTENSSIHNILFGRTTGTNARQLSSICRIYGFKAWEDGTLIRNMIPCMRESDSVLGMYDVVNSVFYTNAGSGTFTASPIV